jgi:lysophospholipase L1-like esterase
LGGTSFTEINAGIGGTESNLGLLRLKRDVLNLEPDIVFLEFAVNDMTLTEEESAKFYEGILYALSKMQKVPYVICAGMVCNHNKPTRAALHRKLAANYGLDFIDVKVGMDEQLGLAEPGVNLVRDRMFAKDNIHPSDEGYGFYFDYIKSQLSDESFKRPIPMVQSEDFCKFTGRFLNAYEMDCEGDWAKIGEGDWNQENFGRKGSGMVTTTAEGALRCRFNGTAFMLCHRIGRDYGKMVVTLDGVSKEIDLYYETDNQPVCWFKSFELEDKEHVLEIRALGTKNEKSTDTKVRIDSVIIPVAAE